MSSTTSIDKMSIQIQVNGVIQRRLVEPRTSLVDFLRDDLGLTGTHVGCEHGVCGACTVMLNDEPVRSCCMFAVQAEDMRITTVEGLAPERGVMTKIQDAFCEKHALQCGYCTPGFIMRALAMVNEDVPATPEAVRDALSGNLCRCTGYDGIVKAICEGLKLMRRNN